MDPQDDTGSIREKESDSKQYKSSFLGLLIRNRNYRLFLSSYLFSHGGEWLTYVASISVIESILGGQTSRTAISILIVVRLLPNVFLSSIGGTLADSRDRRESMILLSLVHSFIPFFYILAGYWASIPMVYLVTFLQECVAALNEPCKSAIVNQLVDNEEDLQKATALTGVSWSCMAAIGSSVGGFVAASYGPNVCFLMDSSLFLCSAGMLYAMEGKYNTAEKESAGYGNVCERITEMTREAFQYLSGKFWWPLVLMKASSALMYGVSDVLNVSFSENGDGDRDEKLGILFAFVGMGCLVGLFVSDAFTSVSRIQSLQWAGIVSLGFSTIGSFGMGMMGSFHWLCFFTLVRSAGSSGTWINSSVLLQLFAAPEKMGRVLALDGALSLLLEATSAMLCGYLQDDLGMGPQAVSLLVSGIGSVLFSLWCCYHWTGRGATSQEAAAFMQQIAEDKADKRTLTEQTPLI